MNVVYSNFYSDLDNLFSEKNNQAVHFEQVQRAGRVVHIQSQMLKS